jgi:hypothetical protein
VNNHLRCGTRLAQDNFPLPTIMSLRKLVLRRDIIVGMGKLSCAKRVPHPTNVFCCVCITGVEDERGFHPIFILSSVFSLNNRQW